MKKWLAAAALGVLILGACGREGPSTQGPLASAEPLASVAPSDEPAASTSPGATTAAGATSAPAATASSAAPAGGGATSAPAAKPPPGRFNTPKDGTYIYNYSGSRSDPFNPGAGSERFSGELTNEISHSGNVHTFESTNSESPGRTTIRTRWSTTKVEMLSMKTESQAGDFSCTFDPPLIITKFPVKAETYPQQQLKGEGNACNGTLDITFERQEASKDATGRSWSAWRVHVKTTVKTDQITITQDETRWVAPELGIEVRSTGSSKATFGGQNFTQTSTSALKSHP